MDENTKIVLIELLETVRACKREIALVTGSVLATSSKAEIMVVVNNIITTSSP